MSRRTKIRAAKIEDAVKLISLFEQLGYPQSREVIEDRLAVYSKRPDHMVFVAEQKENIVGLLALAGREHFIQQSKAFRIVALIVDEKCRGQGIGKMLIQQAEIYGKSQGGKMIELTSGLRRAESGSHDFYKSLGYKNEGDFAKLFLRKEL